MLPKRFIYDKKPIISLNEIQIRMKEQIEKKIERGMYSFEEVSCCICGGKNFKTLSEKDRYGLYVSVVICKDCGLIQTNPRMTQESYNQFYDTEYRKLYTGKIIPTEEFFKNQYNKGKRIFKYLQEKLKININNLNILEVGTGAGGILKYFKEKGNEVYGCDLGSEYIDFGKKRYGLNLFNGTINSINTNWHFDIVIYSHVLEHVLNPIAELNRLKSIIDKDSYIYIEVPGVKYLKYSYDMNFLKQLQNAHIYYFILTTLKNLLGKVDYDLVAGDECIHSIFKLFNRDKEYKLKNDYYDTVSFLKKMEFYRFFPTPYNIKRLITPMLINFLKQVGMYSVAKKIYHKIKTFLK